MSKKRKREDYHIEKLQDLIDLSYTDDKHENFCIDKLKSIRKELIELNNLCGLENIKQSILDQLLYYLQGLHSKSDDYLNTIITGPSGVGKTTIAKILGRIFSKLGILSDSKFVIARRDNLISGYLGQTAIKTQKLLESTQGGVLFIDEVYSLGNPKKDSDSFSKEAIDTINLFLSEYKDDFMLIVAGYEKEVEECFFSHNIGLRRRFMWHHRIDDYSLEDLVGIFNLKIRKSGWKLSDEVSNDFLLDLLKNNKNKFEYNGGDIENFISLGKVQHARRCIFLKNSERKILNRIDLETSISKFKKEMEKDSGEKLEMYI